jgi:hypothetical protein
MRLGRLEEKRLVRLPYIATAVLFVPVGHVSAQTIGPEAVARGVTIETRPRSDYEALGVRLEGFRLDGALETGLGFSDNLVPQAERKRSGVFVEEAVQFGLNSDWTRHAVGITASQATRQHLQHSELNWNDYAVGLDGRYDIGRASSLGFRYDHIRGHLDVTDFDVEQRGATRPLPFDTDRARVTGTAAINRLSLTGALEYARVRYEEEGRLALNDGIFNRAPANDHDRILGELGLAYSFLPGRAVTLTTRLTDINYRQDARTRENSFTWEVLGGVRYDLTGLWSVRFSAGYRHRNYEGADLPSLSGPAFEGQVVYLPSQLTTVTLSASRTIEESIRADSVSFIRTQLRVSADHEFRRNIILSTEVRGEHREYQQPRETVTDLVAIIGARFLISRNLSLLASYQRFERLHAPRGLREYDQNLFQLRLRIAL